MTANTAHIDVGNYRPDAKPTGHHAYRGRRVRRGMVWHFIPEPTPTTAEKACGWEPINLWDILAASFAATPDLAPIHGTPCDDCGCLLRDPDELCPNCVLPWMYAQEKAFNERRPVVYYRAKTKQVAA